MGQNPICNKILLEIFQICPFYMTLCSSWVDETASHCHTLVSERCRREIKCQKASLLQWTEERTEERTDDSICFALIASLSP